MNDCILTAIVLVKLGFQQNIVAVFKCSQHCMIACDKMFHTHH